MNDLKKVLSIAGSDSGGGAGIQADLKTFAALQVYGMTAITAVTAQNTMGVQDIQGISPKVITAQIEVVVSDIGVDAVKTGMLHNSEVIETVAKAIDHYRLPNVVVDPVMVATSGARLLEPTALETLKTKLLPKAKVLTPNTHEAEIIAEHTIKTVKDAENAAEKIAGLGPEAVLVKGGHLDVPGKAVDVLYVGDVLKVFESPLVETKNTHGTGCSLSSAIAAGLAKEYTVIEAVSQAKELIYKGIKNSLNIGKGVGPVNPLAALYDEAEKHKILEEISEAIKIVESKPSMRGLVAECQMNIGMAASHAVDPRDIAAVDGRLTKHLDGVRAQGSPRFGVSHHIASTILAVREYHPQLRAALNIAYTEKTVETMKEIGLLVSSYDRRKEPEEYKTVEGMTTRWGAGEAMKQIDGVPDAFYHTGDWGKEAMIVLLGETATSVAEKAARIADQVGE